MKNSASTSPTKLTTAVVILNWNGVQLLEQFLPSVCKYSPQASIYIADNASTDSSIIFIQEHYPEVIIIKNTQNGGYAKGYNDALQHIDADIYCLLNSDVEVTNNWLQPILEKFESDRYIAAVQPKILDYKNKSYFEYAGAAGGFIDQFGYPYCRGRIFDTIEKDTGQYDDSIEIFWASGACFFVRKQVFEEVGKLDEAFFAHQEEIDLCWRIRNYGYKIMYEGKSHVYHLGGATLHSMNPKKTYLNFRNSLFNLVKNCSSYSVVIVVFVRMLLDGLAAIQFITSGKISHAFAILRAHISFYKNFNTFRKKRKKLPSQKKYFRISSVVWQYFISKRKYYNQL
ncbi:glycosyltransferase family 2 protein [Aquimarina sp. W85]|uniref:glycosyltransferase family 2 protein n=1 Tax=Aquimarina rhodophyticola TaxID=3342246 RepID=UPI00366D0801